ncbi:MAG: PspA/IM30 family protein [Rhodopirellula sp.]|nr:PspA/IM30 family protein [Rhodopirellula sp.]
MTYFSRLTDIVTCNLTRLLEEADDPTAALQEIIAEMEAGMAGAQRSMRTAQGNEDRIRGEVEEHSVQITHWSNKAKEHLIAGAEDQARLALVRKREVDDLVAGLKQQLLAAEQTREHLATTSRALEARLAEARRRQQSGTDDDNTTNATASAEPGSAVSLAIEDELAALKRELGQS